MGFSTSGGDFGLIKFQDADHKINRLIDYRKKTLTMSSFSLLQFRESRAGHFHTHLALFALEIAAFTQFRIPD